MARRFKVIDDSDIAGTIKETAMPGEVKNFMIENITDVVYEDKTIAEIKEMLTEKGIKFEHGQKKEHYIKLIKNGD